MCRSWKSFRKTLYRAISNFPIGTFMRWPSRPSHFLFISLRTLTKVVCAQNVGTDHSENLIWEKWFCLKCGHNHFFDMLAIYFRTPPLNGATYTLDVSSLPGTFYYNRPEWVHFYLQPRNNSTQLVSRKRKQTGREQSQTGHIIIISTQTATFHPELALLPAIFSCFCP